MRDDLLVLKARAKINLALDVLFRRPDGYHEVAMVMQSVALADRVTLEADSAISVAATAAELECGPSNLAYRAAALLRERCGVDCGVRITLEKNIPLAAGLAGGSADAAAVLRGLNRLWGLGLKLAELENIGAALGSDVPFCLRGGTALATGRGEALAPLPPLPSVWVVLAKPPVAVSTPPGFTEITAAIGLRPSGCRRDESLPGRRRLDRCGRPPGECA
jgi:4-diphosphocytidyl-2-C-methyl-D-erythritol kinase